MSLRNASILYVSVCVCVCTYQLKILYSLKIQTHLGWKYRLDLEKSSVKTWRKVCDRMEKMRAILHVKHYKVHL